MILAPKTAKESTRLNVGLLRNQTLATVATATQIAGVQGFAVVASYFQKTQTLMRLPQSESAQDNDTDGVHPPPLHCQLVLLGLC